MSWLPVIVSGVLSGGLVVAIWETLLGARIKRRIEHQFDIQREKLSAELAKEADTHRARVRLFEFLYPKQIQALNELHNLLRTSLPSKSFPDMEWEDACTDMALSFDLHRSNLDKFLALHAGILPGTVVDKIQAAMNDCEEGKFHVQEMEVDREGLDIAARFYRRLDKAVDLLREKLEIDILGLDERKTPESP